MDGDISRVSRKAEEFRELHESLQHNLQTYLPLTMDVLAALHQRVKTSAVADASRQLVRFSLIYLLSIELTVNMQTLTGIRKKSRSLMVFAGLLKYCMSPDVYSYLARLDVEIAL